MLRDRSSSRQFGGRRISQSKIIWLGDCSSAPQMHLDVSSMPRRYRHVPKRPTPVLSLFSATHRLRGSSEPGGRQTAGVHKSWASGLALSHAAPHDSRRLKPEFASTAAWRQKERRWMQALCAEELCTMSKGMKGLVSVQLCLERQLENGVFPTQVGRWNAREYW